MTVRMLSLSYIIRRGLNRMEKQIRDGRLAKSHINKRDNNNYPRITRKITSDIDHDKYNYDQVWDRLKGKVVFFFRYWKAVY